MAGGGDVILHDFVVQMGLLFNMSFGYYRSCVPDEKKAAYALWEAIKKIMESANSCTYCVTQMNVDGMRADYARCTPEHLVLRTLNGHKFEVHITDPITKKIMRSLLA